jgi:hypothetical protein
LSHKIGGYLSNKKELHITNQQEPHANEMNEHLSKMDLSKNYSRIFKAKVIFFDAQISL